MEDTLLLDKRTQSLVEDYVPEGEILDGIVCFFFNFCGQHAGPHIVRIGDHGNVRDGYIARSGYQSDDGIASVAAFEKCGDRKERAMR